MANDPKYIRVFGVRLKLETSYLAGGTLAATDAVLIEQDDPPEVPLQYSHQGQRPGSPGSGGLRRRLAQSGGFIDGLQLTTAMRGSGAAYSASVLPFDQHVLNRISGLNAAIDTTGGAEKVTYTPTSGPSVGGSFASAVGEFYAEMEMVKLKGLIADFKMSMKDSGPLQFMHTLKGVVDTLHADTLLPTMTYMDGTIDPPKCDSVAYTITPSGGSAFTPEVRSFEFDQKRKLGGQRSNRNANGHSGFAMGPGREPTIVVTIEKVDAATFDPRAAQKAGTVFAHAFSITGGNYNKFDFAAGLSQISDVKDNKDDPLAMWDLTFPCYPSTLVADDDFSLVYKK